MIKSDEFLINKLFQKHKQLQTTEKISNKIINKPIYPEPTSDIKARISATQDTIYGLECSIERMERELAASKLHERQQARIAEEIKNRKGLLAKVISRLSYK